MKFNSSDFVLNVNRDFINKILDSFDQGTLKSLNFICLKSENNLWKTLLKKKSLEVINITIRNDAVEDLNIIFEYLFNNDTLKIFDLYGSHYTFTFPISIKKNLSLEVLKLSWVLLNDENLKLLNQFLIDSPNLKKLSLRENELSDKGINLITEGVFSNKNLLKLTLISNNIKNCHEFAEGLEKNDFIECLKLNNTNISKKLLSKSIKNHKKLKKLKIDGLSYVENEWFIEMFEGLPNLTYLDIKFNNIEDQKGSKIILKLAEKKHLKRLNISNNLLGEQSSNALAYLLNKNQEIEILNLNTNELNSSSIVNILEGLNDNHSLKELNLDNNLTLEDDIEFQKLSFQNKSLKTLDLTSCFNSPLFFEILMGELIDNDSLTSLNFSENKIYISEISIHSLICNSFIQFLDLNLCSLSEQDVKNLCKGLKDNKTLTELSIRECNIKDEECKDIDDIFNGTSIIKTIDLSDNKIHDVGIKYLDKIFMKCTSIDLHSNKFTQKSKDYIVQRAFFNYNLKSFDLLNNHIEECPELENIIERNKGFIKHYLKIFPHLFSDMNFKFLNIPKWDHTFEETDFKKNKLY